MQEYSESAISQAFAGSKKTTETSTPGSSYKHEAEAGMALKLRGLPYQVTTDDIRIFFAGYNAVDSSIKIGMNPDGRKTGEGSVLFKTEEDARRAFKEKQGQNIGHRYVELYIMSAQDFNDFEKNQFYSTKKTVRLAGQVNPEDRNKVLKVRGLPYSVTEEDICYFFKEFKIINSDVIIEVMNGKRTGYALVFFDSDKSA